MTKSNLPPATLIVGSDSIIGRALFVLLCASGEKTIGTTRRNEMINDTNLFLDLSDNPDKWTCSFNISTAIICAGITNLSACKENPESTSRINTKSIVALVKNLISKGIYVVYLSTNQVFDGNVPYRKPDDPYSPITEYGRQKAETERTIKELGNSIAIVRFTKILEPDYPLFSSWVKTLHSGKPVHPFLDMYMAPVPLSYAVSVLHQIGAKRISGIFQVSGTSDISYADAADIGTGVLGTRPDLIQPVKASQPGYPAIALPSNTTLNTDRAESILGVETPDSRQTIKEIFQTI